MKTILKLRGALLLCLSVTLLGCASTSFPYRYYTLKAHNYNGMLLGKEKLDDVSLMECEPKTGEESACIVMKRDEYLQLKFDYQVMQDTIEECQSSK